MRKTVYGCRLMTDLMQISTGILGHWLECQTKDKIENYESRWQQKSYRRWNSWFNSSSEKVFNNSKHNTILALVTLFVQHKLI